MAQSGPFLIAQAFHHDRVNQRGCRAQGFRSVERRLQHDGCNSPERKMKLRSGEDREFSNN
jgi:hypothetical protein